MEITQQLREHAAKQGLDSETACAAGLTTKSVEGKEPGCEGDS